MDVKEQILMEAGTNELEILVFNVGEEKFGINVAKIREVIRLPKITYPPNTHPLIEGVMNLRNFIIPVINLRRALGYPSRKTQESDRVIVSEFHKQWFGFIVDSVQTICRISWKDIDPPPVAHQHANNLTGIAHVEEELVLMLDVETITQVLIPMKSQAEETHSSGDLIKKRGMKRILTADDSGMIRTVVNEKLQEAGYTNVTITINGEEAWDALQRDRGFDVVITDIEMPRIDGLHLTKLIKAEADFKKIPVIIFSSIISEDNRNKGEAVGADCQITKPDLPLLVGTVDRLLGLASA
ncbi:MAG: chemotaxis protein [Candidatus Omnitrophota bacterium]